MIIPLLVEKSKSDARSGGLRLFLGRGIGLGMSHVQLRAETANVVVEIFGRSFLLEFINVRLSFLHCQVFDFAPTMPLPVVPSFLVINSGGFMAGIPRTLPLQWPN